MAAVVTTGEKDGEFDTVVARTILVKNDAGNFVVDLGANDNGDGFVATHSAMGKTLVELNATVDGEGMVTTFKPNGKSLVRLGSTGNGGLVEVTNNTGEIIGQIISDKDGNGVVSSANRKGDVRELKPGP